MKYNTINTIIDDIMLEMRRNNITESESYSRKQIEQWIIQYRMFIIKELANNKLPLSSIYYQRFVIALSIGAIASIGDASIGVLSTVNKIPDYVSSDIGDKFISSYDMFGNEIQIVGSKRAASSRFSRFANINRPVSYIGRDKKYHLQNCDNLSEIEIGGIFIDPTEVSDYDYENEIYPMDPSSLPRLKQLIFQGELKYNLLPDTKNDGKEEHQYSKK